MEWIMETEDEKYAPSERMQTLMRELERDDPNLDKHKNRVRFVDATIADARDKGHRFEDEDELRRDALAYLDGLLES